MDNALKLPDLCSTHQKLLVRQLGLGPNDPWQAALIVTQVALFQGASCDAKVHAEVEGKVENFHKLGCLACRKPDLFGEIVETGRKSFPRSNQLGAIKALGESWIVVANASRKDEADKT